MKENIKKMFLLTKFFLEKTVSPFNHPSESRHQMVWNGRVLKIDGLWFKFCSPRASKFFQILQ